MSIKKLSHIPQNLRKLRYVLYIVLDTVIGVRVYFFSFKLKLGCVRAQISEFP